MNGVFFKDSALYWQGNSSSTASVNHYIITFLSFLRKNSTKYGQEGLLPTETIPNVKFISYCHLERIWSSAMSGGEKIKSSINVSHITSHIPMI